MISFELDIPKELTEFFEQKIKEIQAYINNKVDYLEALENGTSKQAPKGMIRQNLPILEKEIDSRLNTLDLNKPLEPQLDKIFDESLIAYHKIVAIETPIDTGLARNSYITTDSEGKEHTSDSLGVNVPLQPSKWNFGNGLNAPNQGFFKK